VAQLISRHCGGCDHHKVAVVCRAFERMQRRTNESSTRDGVEERARIPCGIVGERKRVHREERYGAERAATDTVLRERLVVTKEQVIHEEVRVRKEQVQRTEQHTDTVRREELRVDKEGDVDVPATRGATTWDQAMPTYRQRWEQRYGSSGSR